MPRTNKNQIWNRAGTLISEELVIIPDSVIEAEEADDKLRQRLPNLRAWSTDTKTDAEYQAMTNAQLRTRLALLDDRLAKLARGMAYLIRRLGVED